MKKMPINPDEVRDALNYDPETGVFRWRRRSGHVLVGAVAGSMSGGYLYVQINRKLYRAHRLAWAVTHGDPGEMEIDHINGDPADNRISNLRLASRSQNCMNRRPRRTSRTGLKGVWFCQGNWLAACMAQGESRHLGSFRTPEDANAAYQAAIEKMHGEFAKRSGR